MSSASPVITWPAPQGVKASPDFAVTVGGVPVHVYSTPVRAEILQHEGLWTHREDYGSERAGVAIWDMAGPVEVVVRPTRRFETAVLLPERDGVVPTVAAGGEVRFALDRPRKLTLMLDGDTRTVLHLFAGEPETDAPVGPAPGLHYFGPGLHVVDELALASGDTVYLAGGAVLRPRLKRGDRGTFNSKWKVTFYHGAVFALKGVADVTIRGRGIVDASAIPHPGWPMLLMADTQRVRVAGITLLNAANWNFVIGTSQDVTVEDVRIVSGRLNSDGINSVNSQRVRITDCFVRSHDDSIVVKTTQQSPPAEDILVTGCTVWNDWGYALGVSYETRADIRKVRFVGNAIIYARHWCLGVHLSDSGTVADIRFEDTAISDLSVFVTDTGDGRSSLAKEPILLKAVITRDVWGKDEGYGAVRGVVIDGLQVYGNRWWPSVVRGEDEDHSIRDLVWRRCTLGSGLTQIAMTDLADMNIAANLHAQDMRIEE